MVDLHCSDSKSHLCFIRCFLHIMSTYCLNCQTFRVSVEPNLSEGASQAAGERGEVTITHILWTLTPAGGIPDSLASTGNPQPWWTRTQTHHFWANEKNAADGQGKDRVLIENQIKQNWPDSHLLDKMSLGGVLNLSPRWPWFQEYDLPT